MRELEYPFDPGYIMKKRRSIKKELLKTDKPFIEKRIAVLGGSTTHDIIDILELFLLNYGIRPTFYESEFNQYWQDAMFDNPKLDEFKPEIIFIHTSFRNITELPVISDDAAAISDKLDRQYEHFRVMWEKLFSKFGAVIIQNNFEMPFYRLMGNKEASDLHGSINFAASLNMKFYEYAQKNKNFFINDINYLSADYGLSKWADPFVWHMYKYILDLNAIPQFSLNLANIIKSLLGKNKKAFVLDLDNTLWGGVVGDDGVEGIEIGHETSMGQVFSEFQKYLLDHKQLGVMLNVCSKNDHENAIAGLNHPAATLKPDDFIIIKANWLNKDENVMQIARELNILPDSLVFVDDNPVERGIVRENVPGTAVPEIGKVEQYITNIDRNGYFEVTNLSEDDIKRNEMYKANVERAKLESTFTNYTDYLLSLNMTAVIKDFDDVYIQRIAQLTNKSNQFNLTTKRFTQAEMEAVMADDRYIRLYGKLEDKYGDNGVITVVLGRKEGTVLHIELWLMSCRVLKRDMELAMLDSLVEQAKKQGIKTLRGYYFKTPKNSMVREFYGALGFTKISEQENGDSEWELEIDNYENKNKVIKVVTSNEQN